MLRHAAETAAVAAWGDCSLLVASDTKAKQADGTIKKASISAEFPSQTVDDLNNDLAAEPCTAAPKEVMADADPDSNESSSPLRTFVTDAPSSPKRPEAASKIELLRRGRRPLINQVRSTTTAATTVGAAGCADACVRAAALTSSRALIHC